MPLTLNFTPEQEQQLQAIADARGLSVEGYLLTVVEAILRPKPPVPRKGVLAAVHRLRNISAGEPEMHTVVDEAVRQMRADVLALKERAVEAVTRMNMLRKTTEQQEIKIAQKQLQALTFVRNDDKEQALRSYQESCVYTQNLAETRAQLEIATKAADDLLSVFKQEEARLHARISPAQSAALGALQNEYAKAFLTDEQMQKRITEMTTHEEWQRQFAEWIQSVTTPLEKPDPGG